MKQTTVLIADDQALIRDGLAAILSMEEPFAVVAKTGDGLEAVALAKRHRPQLILMDIQMPKLNGLEATKQIKAVLPDTKVLILTTFEDDDYIWEAIQYGASGFLIKGVETKKMLATIQDCLEGRINFPGSIQKRLMQELYSKDSALSAPPAHPLDERLGSLTLQERNVVRLLKQGKSNQAIASELFLTTGTVKNYLSIIYKKLNVSSRSEAVAYLHEHDV